MPELKIYVCEFCKKAFKSYSGHYAHTKKKTCVNSKFECNHCHARFKTKRTLLNHMTNNCKQKEDEHNELEKMRDQFNEFTEQMKAVKEQMKEKEKEIEKLKEQCNQVKGDNVHGNKNVSNIQNHGNINNIHLHINPHGRESLENVNIKKMIEMISLVCQKNDYSLIPNMVKYINFEMKENRNVYIPNIRANYGLTLENNEWNMKDMDELLNDMLMDNADRLDDFIRNNEEQFINMMGAYRFEELKRSVDEYINKVSAHNTKEKSACMLKIKKILRRERKLVNAFYQELTGLQIQVPK